MGATQTTAVRPVVTLAFRNGLTFRDGCAEIFGTLASEFTFVESESPRICISGPYGNAQPAPGAFQIAYLCENIRPEPDRYDWCFGTWSEEVVRHPRYTRITWHGFDPASLVKTEEQVEAWLARPRQFCSFFYSNPVAHRESFCRALSRYKQVDCPGRSLRNMPPIDDGTAGPDKWTRKREFLAQYRFTIAFENTRAPGYRTEKILDPMLAGSIPIYWGDPRIAAEFNPRSFILASDYVTPPLRTADRLLRLLGRRTLRDYQPAQFKSAADNARRRLHRLANLTADALLRIRGWEPLVAAVRRLDNDPDQYAAMLAEPWLPGNRPPANDPMKEQWRRLLTAHASPV
jgi:hypothetical protein